MAEATTTDNTTTPPGDPKRIIHLIIRNTRITLFDGDVKYLTSENDKGKFDVLPLHENFISLIQKYITFYKLDGEKQTMEIPNGVMHVANNAVQCYIDLISAPTPSPLPQGAVQTPPAQKVNS